MDNERLYQKRADRITRAINLEPVDRIPIIYMATAFSPRFMGMTQAEFVTNPDAPVEVTIAAMDRLGDLDGINMMPSPFQTVKLSLLWLSKIARPGKELPEDELWQVQEAELMTVDDYDFILDKGWNAFLEGYRPKILDMPLYEAHIEWIGKDFSDVPKKFRKAGYDIMACGSTTIPFESLCGARSMPKFFLDLYRIPDKVKAVMDVMLPNLIKMGIRSAELTGVPRVWVGGWRSASALLAPKIWDTLVFPYFCEVINALSEKGILSVLHWDQDWTRDLSRLLEFPPKKCVLNLDGMTDVRKVKEILGDHIAILGDVPAAMFATGSPDDIYEYVKSLVRDVGPTGLLLCPGCDGPINTKPENMEAFVAAGREFGVVG
ncbi:MAG: uroporphyrinogen decarboxylase family protein [Desulfobacteraceae bacterium]|jgi:uroporphyrinogen-III decarboxylase